MRVNEFDPLGISSASSWRVRREGGKEGRREGGKEGRREGGKEGRREGGKEGRREGGRRRKARGHIQKINRSPRHRSLPNLFSRAEYYIFLPRLPWSSQDRGQISDRYGPLRVGSLTESFVSRQGRGSDEEG
jgi:hypothetical protein